MARKVRGKLKKQAHTGNRRKKEDHNRKTCSRSKKWINKHTDKLTSDPIRENAERREKIADKVNRQTRQTRAVIDSFIQAGGVIPPEAVSDTRDDRI